MVWPILIAIGAGAAAAGYSEASKFKIDQDNKNQVDESNFQMGMIDPQDSDAPVSLAERIAATAGGDPYTPEQVEGFDFLGTSQSAQEREAASVGTPQMSEALIARGAQGEMRQGQQGLLRMLKERAQGKSQSAAELQMRRAQGQNVAAARSLAVSQQGVSPAMALRSAQEAGAQTNIATTQGAGVLRAQEQAQAESMYGQVLSGVRGQDIGLATSQAELLQQSRMSNLASAQQANQSNLSAEMQQRQLNDSMTQYWMSLGFSRDQAQLQANIAMEQLQSQQALGYAGVEQAGAAANQQVMGQMVGAGASAVGAGAQGAGTAAGAGAVPPVPSDRRAKKKIKRSKDELDEFMDNLKAYSYEYKKEKHGKGSHTSVMAQDLEKSKLGSQMVKRDEEGTKVVDYGQGLAAMLASTVRLNERIKKLEGDR